MKKLLLPMSFALAGMLTLSSCQDFPTVKTNANFDETLTVNTNSTSYSENKLVDANSDSDFTKYKKKINSIDVERITYTVTSFGGPSDQVLTTGTIEVGDQDGNNRVVLHTMTNVNLPAIAGQETDITASAADLKTLEGFVLNDPNKFTTFVTGKVNKGPVKMAINLKFYTKLKTRVIGSN